jgi:hypothetical protein
MLWRRLHREPGNRIQQEQYDKDNGNHVSSRVIYFHSLSFPKVRISSFCLLQYREKRTERLPQVDDNR